MVTDRPVPEPTPVPLPGKIVPEFNATPVKGISPLLVQFADTSLGNPTSWMWDFGDGDTSIQMNPLHQYTVPGTYQVTMVAQNDYYSGSQTKPDLIIVS